MHSIMLWGLRSGLFNVASRLIAGVFVGYAVAVAFSVWLSFVLPMQRADAVATGILVSFAAYTLVILWAFGVGSHKRTWTGLLLIGIACGAFAWLAAPTVSS
ncbi:MAG: hypothetical protein P1V34_03165 [Alphaproteobacteria bacterium]|nr:hypothetical protein [Alphaproteobacteria bacterium]